MISPIMNPNQEKKTSEQNRKKDMEIKNKPTVMEGAGERDITGKEGEGTSQGTCIKDPWAWTMGWRLGEGGQGRGQQWGKMWDNCN